MSLRFILASVVPLASLAVAGSAVAQEFAKSVEPRIVIAQAPPPVAKPPVMRPAAPAKATPAKNCRREPIWGFRMSAFCKPTGICSDRVIKGYRTVCS